eukprot:gene16042-21269_t
MNRYFLSIALGLLAAGSANAAPFTGEGGPAPSQRVSYADLDLDRPAGITTLRSRISAAAHRLCQTSNVAPLAEKVRETRCYRTAIADAYDQVHRNQAQRFAEAPPNAPQPAYRLRVAREACMIRLMPSSPEINAMAKRILMIEDDQRLATMVATYLGQNGYVVTHSATGERGLAALRDQAEGSFAAVLLDLMLPDSDGLDLCRQIRALPSPTGSMPIVMLTAKGDPMD